VWNYGFDVEDHRQCSERRKDLEAGQARLHQQIDIGDQLAAQLIDDHLSLVDAADMILNANKDRSGFIEAMGYQYGTSTSPRQRCARYLMLHVELRLRDTGATSRVPETLTRLEVDYRAMPPNP
jgi:hypothetical protein